MSTPRNIVATGASGRMRIEYLKGRRALRLTMEEGGGPVEVPLASLVDRLDVERRDLAPRPRLLLFTGRHDHPGGGAGDLAGWYESEIEARAAFRGVRESTSDDEGWAQLVALDGGARTNVVAWFGRPGADAGPRQQRLRVVGERQHHPAGRGARGQLRLLLR